MELEACVMSAVLLVAVVLAPLFGGMVAVLIGRRWPRSASAGGAVGAGLGFAGATVLAVAVALQGSVAAVMTDSSGRAVVGVVADRTGVVLLLLVCGVSTLVQVFAGRYLAGDRRRGRFIGATALLTTASAALATAVTLPGLAVAWTLAGVALCLLLATYSGLPGAREGVRHTARTLLVGDLALWAVVALVTVRYGMVDLRAVPDDPAAGWLWPAVVGSLVVIAALTRSAQVPWHGWLSATVNAPTPVSALLHAGVVNAGGVLLVRLHPVVGVSAVAMWLAVVAGLITVVYGTAVMLTRPDIKGSLVYSTVAQMGFMIMTCGLGLYAVAVVHLVAHGVYKATLFLGSGAAVRRYVRQATAPPPATVSPVRHAAVSIVAAVACAGALLVLRPAGSDTLLVFTWATAVVAAAAWLRRRPGFGAAAMAVAVLVVVVPGYAAVMETLTHALGLPSAAAPTSVVVVVGAAVVALLLLDRVRRAPAASRLAGLQHACYVWCLGAGQARIAVRRRLTTSPRLGVADRPHPIAVGASS